MTMKITQSKLKQIIAEELEALKELTKDKKFEDVDSWFKSFFGFKSSDAKYYIRQLENQIKFMENTPMEEVKYKRGFDQTEENDDLYRIGDMRSSEFISYDHRAALGELPDSGQRKKAYATTGRWRDVFEDFQQRVWAHYDKEHARQDAEEKEAKERKRREYEARKRAKTYEEEIAANRSRKKPSKFDQSYKGKEWYRGQRNIGADYEDLSDLFESKKITKTALKQIIAEEIKLLKKEKGNN